MNIFTTVFPKFLFRRISPHKKYVKNLFVKKTHRCRLKTLAPHGLNTKIGDYAKEVSTNSVTNSWNSVISFDIMFRHYQTLHPPTLASIHLNSSHSPPPTKNILLPPPLTQNNARSTPTHCHPPKTMPHTPKITHTHSK